MAVAPSPTNLQLLYRYSSAANCSISLKYDTEFDHVTPDVLRTVNGQRSTSRYKSGKDRLTA